MTVGSAVPEEVGGRMLEAGLRSFAVAHGGCTYPCAFEVRMGFDLGNFTHVIELRHSRRDEQLFEVASLGEREPIVRAVLRAAEPWLRGLHRFPIECGIK